MRLCVVAGLAGWLAAGCACERRIEIEGDGDAGGDGAIDTAVDHVDTGDLVDAWDSADPGEDSTLLDTGMDAPEFELPDMVEWDPYEEHVGGEPGWRDSTEPLCNEPGADWDWFYRAGYDVWSDGRGVFAYMGTEFQIGYVQWQFRLYLNDGTGWSVYADLDSDDLGISYALPRTQITGIPSGPLMLFAPGNAIVLIEDGELTTTGVNVNGVFMVDASLGYAALPAYPRLARWDGSIWSPFPGDPVPYDIDLVWADHESVYCAGQNGTMLSLEDGEWVVHDARTMENFIAIWGFGHDDVWASTSEGSLVHFDGASWGAVEWPDLGDDSDTCRQHGQSIQGMWGMDGILYMHTMWQFFAWDGSSFTVLAYWPGAGPPECTGRVNISAIWGNSPNEVFLSVDDRNNASRECGREEFLLWWDGAEFHWF